MLLGFNFLSHGSQDLYPVYLETTKGFTAAAASKATIISNCGTPLSSRFLVAKVAD